MEAYLHRQIHDRLLAARKPVFLSDRGIDGDSLGSSLAMADWLKSRGVHVPVHVSGPVPEKYRGLPLIEHCVADDAIFTDPDIDLIVTFDCSDSTYVQGLIARLPKPVPVINIDHHNTNPEYGDINLVLVNSSATAEVVHRFFKTNGITPSRDAATLLFAGICFDTGNLQNASTNVDAFTSCSELLLHGARMHDIIRFFFANRSVGALKLWGRALERLAEFPGGFVSTYLTRADMEECGVSEEEADGLSNFIILSVEQPTFVWFRETSQGGVKASLRSVEKDVSIIAKHYGGGGHAKSCGFTLADVAIRPTEDGWVIPGHEDMYAKIEELLTN